MFVKSPAVHMIFSITESLFFIKMINLYTHFDVQVKSVKL